MGHVDTFGNGSLSHGVPPCYWVLLSNRLEFCYTSPSFNAAVPDANHLLGRSFLDYLNPYFQGADRVGPRLQAVFNETVDRGDVINIHYATLPAIQHHLSSGQLYRDSNFTYDKFQFVVSRAGGFILGFVHSKTVDAPMDCNFDLYDKLASSDFQSITRFLPSLDPEPPYHVFQILSNDEERTIIFTTSTTVTGKLSIVPNQLAGGTRNTNNFTTNAGLTGCTKRSKSTFIITTLEGKLLNVISIILRHVMYRLTPINQDADQTLPQVQPPNSIQTGVQPPIMYNNIHPPGTYSRRPSAASDASSQFSPPVEPWWNSRYPESYDGPSHDYPVPGFPLTPAFPEYAKHSPSPHHAIGVRGPRSRDGHSRRRSDYRELEPIVSPDKEVKPEMSFTPPDVKRMSIYESGLPPPPLVPPNLPQNEPAHISPVTADQNFDSATLRSRPSKEPPKGVQCCRNCRTTVTPEWRKGPTGVKDMCNACGLRWNRRMKKTAQSGVPPNGAGSVENGDNPISIGEDILGDPNAILPQRSGGGSKKGHRKKLLEARGPALTTRPAKRRMSFRSSGSPPLHSPTTYGSPSSLHHQNGVPLSPSISPHTSQHVPYPMHPPTHHNMHQHHHSNSGGSSRPPIPSQFHDGYYEQQGRQVQPSSHPQYSSSSSRSRFSGHPLQIPASLHSPSINSSGEALYHPHHRNGNGPTSSESNGSFSQVVVTPNSASTNSHDHPDHSPLQSAQSYQYSYPYQSPQPSPSVPRQHPDRSQMENGGAARYNGQTPVIG